MATKIVVNGQKNGVIAFKGDHEPCAVYVDGVRQDNVSYKSEPIEGENSVSYNSEYKKNIRTMQIEGNTFQQTYSGKNLFDENNIIKGYSTGNIDTITPSNAYRIVKIDNLKAGTYTISFSTPFYLIRQWIDGQMKQDLGTINTTYTFTTTTDNTYGICFRKSDSSEIIEDFTVQVEKGSTATEYEPYVGGMASPNAGSSTGTPASPVIDTIDSYKDSNYLANEWVAGCITPIELPEQGKTYRVWVDEAQFQAQASTFAYLEIYIGTSFEQVTSGSDSNGSSKQLAFNQYGQCTFNTVEMSENFYIGIGNTYEGISGHETTCWEALKNISVYIQTEPYESTLVEIPAYPQPIHNANDSRLPSEYQEVEYIESTGTQYIDTGVVPNNETGFSIDVSFPETSTDMFRFGCRKDSGETRFVLGTTLNRIYFGFGISIDGGVWSASANNFYNAKLNYLNSRVASVDDKNEVALGNLGVTDMTYSIIMFGRNSGGSITSSAQTIKACKISQGTSIIRDFVPCYRISDNKVGMYDLANGVFYTNAGTGEFVKGETVSRLSLELRGINLLNTIPRKTGNNADFTGVSEDSVATLNGTKTSESSFNLIYYGDVYLEAGKTYTGFIEYISGTRKSGAVSIYYYKNNAFFNQTGSLNPTVTKTTGTVSITESGNYNIRLAIKPYGTSAEGNKVDFDNLKVRLGIYEGSYKSTTIPPFQPYFKTTIQIPTSVTVDGKNVDLRMSIYDKIIVDKLNNKVIYSSGTWYKEFTGDEDFYQSTFAENNGYGRYFISINDISVSGGYCTHFKRYSWLSSKTVKNVFSWVDVTSKLRRISFKTDGNKGDTFANDKAKFKALLKSFYNAGTPVTVLANLSTPVETVLYDKANNISTELGEALFNLPTQNQTNLITITSTPSVSKLSVNYAKWGGAK